MKLQHYRNSVMELYFSSYNEMRYINKDEKQKQKQRS